MVYKGEISLLFDPPSQHSCRTRSPLLWALIRISASRTECKHLTTNLCYSVLLVLVAIRPLDSYIGFTRLRLERVRFGCLGPSLKGEIN